MKIVCDSCQAKYSIADEKIQGKSFKIRCKKCNHIIVVRVSAEGASSGGSADRVRATGGHVAVAASSARAAAPAGVEQAGWHVVIDGQQVGPMTESDIKDRLRQGKINSDTLVWKEGFGDWTQLSAVPELTPLLARVTRHPAPAKAATREPARNTGAQKAVSAAPEPAAEEGDPFAAPTVVSPAGSADLFASAAAAQPQVQPAAAPASAPVSAPAATSPFLFGGGQSQPIEPLATRPEGGNGVGNTTQLTGQRNENSVLFSLANLEALAVPSQPSNIRAPSSTSNTEGSGLIDIRSMAAMTLGDSPAGESRRSADALPTFSTPQFSPVAPVLLPISTSGPPKWVYPALGFFGIAIVALAIVIFKVASAPPPGLPPPPPPVAPKAAPVAARAPAPTAAPSAQEPSAAPTKPAEEEKPTAKAEDKGSERTRGGSSRGRRRGESSSSRGSSDSRKGGSTSSAASATPPPDTSKSGGRKGKGGSLDDLLGEVGSKRGGGSPEPSKPAVKLATLTQSDIVNAMRGVQPKVQNCANQYRAPGTAMAKISVAAGGRVSSAKVTGKFAGTPTASCVEAAARSAKFPPCQPMTFPWPFTLIPR